MASIEVTCSRPIPTPEARRRAEEFVRSVGEELGVNWRWEGDTILFTATSGRARGAHGRLVIGEDFVSVAIDLPFLLRPWRARLGAQAHARLRETFMGSAAPARGRDRA
jgi:Putative polyhydroxyalkanoic acid system protein (PHA_gran_rgn)